MQHSAVMKMSYVSGEYNVRSQNPFSSQKNYLASLLHEVRCMELTELTAERKYSIF